jgi:hypothetical protein
VKYFVYYNLHKHVFSLKNNTTKKVEKRSSIVLMQDCVFKVSEKGRQRVLREKVKNVHAGVLGELISTESEVDDTSSFVELTYNPYIYDSFVVKESGKPVLSAKKVYLINKKVFAENVSFREEIKT